MRIRVLLVTVLLACWCESGAARVRAVRGWMPRPSKILVITAHPDDEVLLAPFLDAYCVQGTASCAILVLTRGERGGDPDVRTGEMAASAALLHLRLMQWSLPDLTEPWPDRDALRLQIAGVIAAEQPDMILTFDPDHGSTGHPAHRETGALVRDTGAANVWYLETLVTWFGERPQFSPAVPNAWPFRGDWSTLIRAATVHASQFSSAALAELEAQQASQRYVWLRQALEVPRILGAPRNGATASEVRTVECAPCRPAPPPIAISPIR